MKTPEHSAFKLLYKERKQRDFYIIFEAIFC